MQLLETSASVAYSSLVFRKNSNLAHQVNAILTKYHDPLERLRQKYISRQHNDNERASDKTIALQLVAFSGLFACVTLLLITATCFLCIERKIANVKAKQAAKII